MFLACSLLLSGITTSATMPEAELLGAYRAAYVLARVYDGRERHSNVVDKIKSIATRLCAGTDALVGADENGAAITMEEPDIGDVMMKVLGKDIKSWRDDEQILYQQLGILYMSNRSYGPA